MPKTEIAHINPLGFREYDARWLYPKDINQEGIKNIGQGLGSQIISKTKKFCSCSSGLMIFLTIPNVIFAHDLLL